MPTTTVMAIQVNDGSAQRSEVRSITATFSDSVMFSGGSANAAAAFQLRRVTDGLNVHMAAAVTTNAQGDTVVTLTFSGTGTDPISALNGGAPSLADGRYTLTIFGSAIINHQFQPLDGDGNGVPGGNYVSPADTIGGGPGQLRLYRVFGDVTGDAIVDQLDLAAFRAANNSSVGSPAYVSSLDADNSGTIDQFDLGQIRSRLNENIIAIPPPQQFFVNPTTGSDANDGRTPATAWQTWGRLVAAVADGTITGGVWMATDGTSADISTIPTNADKEAWYTAYLQGKRQLTGAHIYIDTSGGPLQVTAPLSLPPGCEIESATSDVTNLEVNLPVAATEVWAQPNAGADPHVWGTTSNTSYQWTGLYEQVGGQWAQLIPIGWDTPVTTLAAALPKLEATPGSFFVDPSTNRLYTHAISGGNPNTDGVARQYVPPWATTLGARIIEVTGGEAYLIGGDGGFGFDPTTGQAQGSAGIGSGEWNDISMIDSCQWSRAGKHTFSATGTQATGFVVFRDDTASEGPGDVFVGYWSHFVDYTGFSGVGSAMSIYDGDKTVNGWANVDAPGGSDADPAYQALIAHTDDATHAFSMRLVENCSFGGGISLGGPETLMAEMDDTTVAGPLSTTAVTTAINRSTLDYCLPDFDGQSATVTDSILVPGMSFTGAPKNIQGTVTLNRDTLDLTHGLNYGTAWTRAGSLTFQLTNSILLNRQNLYYGLIAGVLHTDTMTIDHSLIQGPATDILVEDYDNAGEYLTYEDGVGDVPGIAITNTQFVDDAKLDPATYVPLSDSPAVGQSVPVNNAPDFTGTIWAVRQTAGALESPNQQQATVLVIRESPIRTVDSGLLPLDPLSDFALPATE